MLNLFKVGVFLILSVFQSQANAQDFQGIATYKSHQKLDLKLNDDTPKSKIEKQIYNQLQKQFQQEYTLTFNKNESIYKQTEQLQAPAQSGIKIQVSQNTGILYKNIKEHRFTKKNEIFGKLFLIKDS